jgi:glutaredoxin-like YruB-family protein
MVKKDAKVRVYSTATCPWCTVAKEFLKKNKIKFEDIDVGEDQVAAQEMIEKSGQMGVPVIEVDGQLIIGFDEGKLKKALDIE